MSGIIKSSTYHPDLFADHPYRMCEKLVMDTTDPEIVFDENGVCNHFHEFEQYARPVLNNPKKEKELNDFVQKVKKVKSSEKYDCLIGLSGGVDSTYVAYLVKQLGLRPLAVHLDNGWNSELAVHNINEIVNRLDIDLHTLVVDWKEFRSIQLAYLKASVVDVEVVSDHAIFATMYKLARKFKIPYIISGTNVATEFIMPAKWLYRKMDFDNLNDINKQFGTSKFKTYPTFSFTDYVKHTAIMKLVPFSILDFIEYNKEEVKKTITSELDWRDYGGKHYESVFTKFYQAYILPQKFGIDKRKSHLSNLIITDQITRDKALKELEEPLYSEKDLANDMNFVLKKFGLKDKEFEDIMSKPPRDHESFKTDKKKRAKYMDLLRKTEKFRKKLK